MASSARSPDVPTFAVTVPIPFDPAGSGEFGLNVTISAGSVEGAAPDGGVKCSSRSTVPSVPPTCVAKTGGVAATVPTEALMPVTEMVGVARLT